MAKDIFGPYWSLVFLGTLAEASPPFHGFGVALRSHAERVEPASRALLRRVRDLGRFDEIVMDLAETDSWWAGEPREPSTFDAEVLALLLSLSRGPDEDRAVPLGSREENIVSCQRAACRELARLLSSFIAAAWVAEMAAEKVASVCEDLFADAMAILGAPFSSIALSSVPLEEILDETYEDVEGSSYKEWVRSIARRLRTRS